MSDLSYRRNVKNWYKIQYAHIDCEVDPGVEWEDEWDCACNGECPSCGMTDIEPIDWEQIEGEEDEEIQ